MRALASEFSTSVQAAWLSDLLTEDEFFREANITEFGPFGPRPSFLVDRPFNVLPVEAFFVDMP